MATRSGGPFETAPIDGVVRSLYSAGLAFVSVGVVATILAWASVLEASGSVGAVPVATTQALGGPVVTGGAESVVLHLAAIAVAVGTWLLGAGFLVDGIIDE